MEVPYQDGVHGDAVITFDGTVLEFFVPGKASSIARLHVRHIYVEVKGPNRRGYYEVDFSTSPRGLGGFEMYVHTETWPWVAPLLEAVRAAAGR
jgi:hypothetical protein